MVKRKFGKKKQEIWKHDQGLRVSKGRDEYFRRWEKQLKLIEITAEKGMILCWFMNSDIAKTKISPLSVLLCNTLKCFQISRK